MDALRGVSGNRSGLLPVCFGQREHAPAAYQDFLVLWKDADHDIPILKQAKAENTKLQ
jgi:hypothetical protein